MAFCVFHRTSDREIASSTRAGVAVGDSRCEPGVACLVVALHACGLWALQSGQMRHPPEVIVPTVLLTQLIDLPAPPPKPPLPTVQRREQPPAAGTHQAPASEAPPLATPTAPEASSAELALSPPAASSQIASSPAAPSAAPPAPAPVRIELPSINADYLHNPKPLYPRLSKQFGEQGRVLVRVLIAADGSPQRVELQQSSGFDRLDQAALETVRKWHFVPGKRGGVAEAMWFNVPIHFVLEPEAR